jgi:hypothetical protein
LPFFAPLNAGLRISETDTNSILSNARWTFLEGLEQLFLEESSEVAVRFGVDQNDVLLFGCGVEEVARHRKRTNNSFTTLPILKSLKGFAPDGVFFSKRYMARCCAADSSVETV